jgi:uncharacterized membrane protein YdjX (TVP38/TMEM64 family)
MVRNEDRVKAVAAIGVAVALYGGLWSIIEGIAHVTEKLLDYLRQLGDLVPILYFGLPGYSTPWRMMPLLVAPLWAFGVLYVAIALAVAARVFKRQI